jgi:hypothetical protein
MHIYTPFTQARRCWHWPSQHADFGTHSAADPAETRAARLAFIGAGTFLVAAYLGSSLCPNLLADSHRADFHA